MPRQQENALIMFCRTPNIVRDNINVKFASLPWEDIDTLFTAFTADLLVTLRHLQGIDVLVYRDPEELSDDYFFSFRQMVQLFDMDDRIFTHTIERAIDSTFQAEYRNVVVLLENSTIITPEFLQQVFDQLGYEDDCFVACPTFEGRCAMIGMKSNHSKLFDAGGDDPITHPNVLLKRLCAIDAHLFLMNPVRSLDSAAGLAFLQEEITGSNSAFPYFPSRTSETFNKLGKKYGGRRVTR